MLFRDPDRFTPHPNAYSIMHGDIFAPLVPARVEDPNSKPSVLYKLIEEIGYLLVQDSIGQE